MGATIPDQFSDAFLYNRFLLVTGTVSPGPECLGQVCHGLASRGRECPGPASPGRASTGQESPGRVFPGLD